MVVLDLLLTWGEGLTAFLENEHIKLILNYMKIEEHMIQMKDILKYLPVTFGAKDIHVVS